MKSKYNKLAEMICEQCETKSRQELTKQVDGYYPHFGIIRSLWREHLKRKTATEATKPHKESEKER